MAGNEEFLSGVPIAVDPEQIDRELSRLWKPERPGEGSPRGAVTRACLSNLVFHVCDVSTRTRVAALVREIGRRFPSRMILLTHGAPPRPSGPALSAWITAVCHLPRPDSSPVCCEQITLEARSQDVATFEGNLMPLLVPDVPVVLVLLGGGGERLAGILGALTDRIVVDSRVGSLGSLELIASRVGRDCLAVDDLAWHDVLPWRRVLADLFDEGRIRELSASLESIEVSYDAGEGVGGGEETGGAGCVPAALLAGWLVSQTGWSALGAGRDPFRMVAVFRRGDRKLRCALSPVSGEGDRRRGKVLEVRLAASDGSGLRVCVEGGSTFRIDSSTSMDCVLPRSVPYRAAGDGDLLGAALERVTHQGVLGSAIRAALTFRGGEASVKVTA